MNVGMILAGLAVFCVTVSVMTIAVIEFGLWRERRRARRDAALGQMSEAWREQARREIEGYRREQEPYDRRAD